MSCRGLGCGFGAVSPTLSLITKTLTTANSTGVKVAQSTPLPGTTAKVNESVYFNAPTGGLALNVAAIKAAAARAAAQAAARNKIAGTLAPGYTASKTPGGAAGSPFSPPPSGGGSSSSQPTGAQPTAVLPFSDQCKAAGGVVNSDMSCTMVDGATVKLSADGVTVECVNRVGACKEAADALATSAATGSKTGLMLGGAALLALLLLK